MKDTAFGKWPETIEEMSRADSALWVLGGARGATICVGFGSPAAATVTVPVDCTCGARERATKEGLGLLATKLREAADLMARKVEDHA